MTDVDTVIWDKFDFEVLVLEYHFHQGYNCLSLDVFLNVLGGIEILNVQISNEGETFSVEFPRSFDCVNFKNSDLIRFRNPGCLNYVKNKIIEDINSKPWVVKYFEDNE